MFVPRIQFSDALTLRLELRHIQPAIWRRVRVPAHYSLASLHSVIQTAFGWTDKHPHSFLINDIEFGMPADDGSLSVNELGAPLGAVLKAGSSFQYWYDFGDDWQHDVLVEAVTANGQATSECLSGARACPPEDCGGPPGYESLLAALASPQHPAHQEMREWLGKRFDPEKLDLIAVNKKLKTLSQRIARTR